MGGSGHFSINSSLISSPLYPQGFELLSYEPESLFNEPKQIWPKDFWPNVAADMDKVSSSSRDEELVSAELALQCKRKKQSNHVMKVNNSKTANTNSKDKTNKSKVPTREDNLAQAIVATNLVRRLNLTMRRKLNALGKLVSLGEMMMRLLRLLLTCIWKKRMEQSGLVLVVKGVGVEENNHDPLMC